MRPTAADIAGLLRGFRFNYATEEQLQTGIAGALESKGLVVEREARIGVGSRIDMIVCRVGIEVKIHGSPADVQRQVSRYLRADEIDGLVLVTSRVRHLRVSGDKPVHVVALAGQGL